MNWFERYAIPGLYFSLYIFLSVFLSHVSLYSFDEKQSCILNVGQILTILAAVSVPAGYLISVFSLWCYYKFFGCCHLHRYAMRIDNPKENREELLEAQTVQLFRVQVKESDVEKYRWASDWLSKRVDVIAMNNSIVIATLLGMFLSPVLYNHFFHSEMPYKLLTWGISIIVISAIFLATNLLSEQVQCVTKALYESKDRRIRHDAIVNQNIDALKPYGFAKIKRLLKNLVKYF